VYSTNWSPDRLAEDEGKSCNIYQGLKEFDGKGEDLASNSLDISKFQANQPHALSGQNKLYPLLDHPPLCSSLEVI
jgi:hypothetical protein